ncbi:hypothetical protein MHY30_11860 [Microbacterium sp. ACRRU]|uniref:hypothetical protein n=1 Tax=Microbacterium sp. ACRRU TaxID=2918204 RepID=UPI001EF68049|nr:hypothetical protein [Microbacterium sp. ACRRU]MCG7418200.1 hypothetical protein [Microbacterium sp. ACRRU]
MSSSAVAKSRSQQAQVSLVGVAVTILAAAAGAAVGLSVQQWLIYAIALSLVLWLGGAVSGQILLARLLDRDVEGRETAAYLRQLLWIIPRIYVPLGFVAVGCGVALIVLTGANPLAPAILVPILLYIVTAVAGSAISAPGYIRLLRANERGLSRDEFRRALLPLAWVNRTELALVLSVGLILLVSLIPTS